MPACNGRQNCGFDRPDVEHERSRTAGLGVFPGAAAQLVGAAPVDGEQAGGLEVALHAAVYLQVRDGHITRIEVYLDSAQ